MFSVDSAEGEKLCWLAPMTLCCFRYGSQLKMSESFWIMARVLAAHFFPARELNWECSALRQLSSSRIANGLNSAAYSNGYLVNAFLGLIRI
jgi:hypothetical protein